MKDRVAVVGSGISGLTCAWLLSRRYEVHLFEAEDRLGGHTHTHDVSMAGTDYRIDSGFIVFNERNYPLLCRIFEAHGIVSQPTSMSFSVSNSDTGLEYNATTIDTLFCQRRNLIRPSFIGMIRDLLRFYREAPALLDVDGPGPTLGAYLDDNGYRPVFVRDHIVPMASALWSTPANDVLDYPAKYMVQFMANHLMLQTDNRPEWRVVKGGSNSYVPAMTAALEDRIHLGSRVSGVRRTEVGVTLAVGDDRHEFKADHVVMACHSDQALRALADPTDAEQSVLGAIQYQSNDTVLHWDRKLLPRHRKAWAAWNCLVSDAAAERCTLTYNMNILQSVDSPEPFCVTLNRDDIDPDKVLARMRYAHPKYDHQSVAAQSRRGEISGHGRTWYCGAYWGWGFHEDGVRSAVEIARALGCDLNDA